MAFPVIQGFCGRQLIIQGWSAVVPACSPISQGLCGPSLVLQGFNPGAAPAVAASGGMSLGGAISAAGPFAADGFAGAPGTSLTSHAPDAGGAWSLHAGYTGAAVISSANRLRSASSFSGLFQNAAAPSSADYDVSADVVPVGGYSTQIAGVAGRIDPVADSYYGARYNGALDAWELYRVVAGSYTVLGSAGSSSLTRSRRLTLRLAGSLIQVLVDGAVVIAATDAAIAGQGKAGLWLIGASTDSAGIHLAGWQASTGSPLAAYAPAASGGVRLGGSASPSAGPRPLAAGGLAVGGQAAPRKAGNATFTGGLRQGGGSPAGLAARPGAAGGQRLGGLAQGQKSSAVLGTGGLARGGTSAVARVWRPVIAGGCGLGGTSVATRSHVIVASGGLALGGPAILARNHVVVAAGGFALGGTDVAPYTVYLVYANTGEGDPIDYARPLAVVDGTTWTSGPLAVPGQYRFGVRARSSANLEEENLDAAVTLLLDDDGADVTLVPPPPLGLRGTPLAGGSIRLEWTCPCTDPRRQPDGFRVYVGQVPPAPGTPPSATVPWAGGASGSFSATFDGLVDGTSYQFIVRSYNGFGEEANVGVVVARADATPPALVDGLAASPSNRES